jgi:hypothetical protein
MFLFCHFIWKHSGRKRSCFSFAFFVAVVVPYKNELSHLPKPKGLLVEEPDVELLLGADEVVTLLPVVFVCWAEWSWGLGMTIKSQCESMELIIFKRTSKFQ